MPLYRPSELRNFLDKHGLAPKKGLSQNFLIDGNVLRKIVTAADVNSEDILLEIGPGPGSLTEILLENNASVIAVEKDTKLCGLLSRFQDGPGNLQICHTDIMNFPLEEVMKEKCPPGKKAKVIANLPYHLTTPILQILLPLSPLFSKIVVMVQDEVARRITAKPGTKEYGAFTLFANFYSNAKYGFKVKRSSFYPAPKVDSAILIFDLKDPKSAIDQEKFFTLTRAGFQMRRKTLRKSLEHLFPREKITAALKACNFSIDTRPQELSLEQYYSLYHRLFTN